MSYTITDLLINVLILIVFIYFTKHNPMYSILTTIFMIAIITSTMETNIALEKTTIECYKLGGCNKDYINKNIIEDYEIELLKEKLKRGK